MGFKKRTNRQPKNQWDSSSDNLTASALTASTASRLIASRSNRLICPTLGKGELRPASNAGGVGSITASFDRVVWDEEREAT